MSHGGKDAIKHRPTKSRQTNAGQSQSGHAPSSEISSVTVSQTNSLTNNVDWDALFDSDEESYVEETTENRGTVLSHIMAHISIGMDLMNISLPTYMLEKRSLLEMYADTFSHPDLFVAIADATDPKSRIVAVLKWYMSSFYASRKSDIAKKPYNPVIGEMFTCYWPLPSEKNEAEEQNTKMAHHPWYRKLKKKSTDSDTASISSSRYLEWIPDPNALMFHSEQVSHHPPCSAFYVEHVPKAISMTASILTNTKFLGLSVGVTNIGNGVITVHHPQKEEYNVTFPNAFARSILTIPWVELGGVVNISSPQTNYHVRIEFLTKGMFGREKHRFSAQAFGPTDQKKPFLTVDGEWNGVMTARWRDGPTEQFFDARAVSTKKKITKPIAEQEYNESRRVWKEVTLGLKNNDAEQAAAAKHAIEERGRTLAKERAARDETWVVKTFTPSGDHWLFIDRLEERYAVLENTQNPNSSTQDT